MQDRMFVIGPNASGKSNLLDALRFLRQVASPGGGFQDAVMTRGGMSRVRCLAARNFNQGHATMGVTIGDDERPARWSYEITFTAESRGRHRPILRSETVERDGETVLRRPTAEDTDDPERMTQTHLEQVNANRDFRQIVEYLGSIRYLHLVPQLIPRAGPWRRPQRRSLRCRLPAQDGQDPGSDPHSPPAPDQPVSQSGGATVGSARSGSGRNRSLASAGNVTSIGGHSPRDKTSRIFPTVRCA